MELSRCSSLPQWEASFSHQAIVPEEKGKAETSHSRGGDAKPWLYPEFISLWFLGLTLSSYSRNCCAWQPRSSVPLPPFPLPQAEGGVRESWTIRAACAFCHPLNPAMVLLQGKSLQPNSLTCWEWGCLGHSGSFMAWGMYQHLPVHNHNPSDLPYWQLYSGGLFRRSVSPLAQHHLFTS